LAVTSSVAVEAEANSTKTAAKVIEAETDLSPTSTDVAGDDEGSETTESVSYVHTSFSDFQYQENEHYGYVFSPRYRQ